MDEFDNARRNRHQLATAAHDFLLAVLPFRHPDSIRALAQFIADVADTKATVSETEIILLDYGAGIGNLKRIDSPHGRWIEFSYDGSNRVTQARDNIGRTVGYQYDASGRLWKVTDPGSGTTDTPTIPPTVC